jgi:hypothetical protein
MLWRNIPSIRWSLSIMFIGDFSVATRVKTPCDPATRLIFPLVEPWIASSIDDVLFHNQPRPRSDDLFSPSRMLRLALLHASRPDNSFQETFREVWQTWQLAGCVKGGMPSSSALAQARARFPIWAFNGLLKHLAQAAEQTGSMPAWPEHRLLSIDGTPLGLANTSANRTHFGSTRHQNGEAYFPQALAVWISRVHPQTVVAEYLGTSREGDESIAPALLPTVLRAGDLLLGDAHFGHYPTLWTIDTAQAFYLVRAPGPLHIEKHITVRHTPDDADVQLSLSPYIRSKHSQLPLPEHMDLRCLVYTIPAHDALNGAERAHFLTNLPRTPFSHERLAALPPLRWNHETLNNDIKSRLGLGELRSLSPEGAHVEVLAHLCLNNILRLILQRLRPEAPALNSFTAGLSAIRQANQQLRMAPERHVEIIENMCRVVLDQPNVPRPKRSEPRMTRPRKRPYPIFKSPRSEWREQRKVG